MDITSLTGISSDYINEYAKENSLVDTSDDGFSSVLDSALSMLNETNDLQNSLHWEIRRIRMICRLPCRKPILLYSIQLPCVIRCWMLTRKL